ncbi:MAG: hypothetical protein VYE18_02170 [Pseudomonadota bacterium]|nr:hypothetical protein [Pseudomonadota bacterium]
MPHGIDPRCHPDPGLGVSIIPPVTTTIASDLMIAEGSVDVFYLCYIGFETLGFAPV